MNGTRSDKDKIKHDWPGVKLQQIFYLCERRSELEITVSNLFSVVLLKNSNNVGL